MNVPTKRDWDELKSSISKLVHTILLFGGTIILVTGGFVTTLIVAGYLFSSPEIYHEGPFQGSFISVSWGTAKFITEVVFTVVTSLLLSLAFSNIVTDFYMMTRRHRGGHLKPFVIKLIIAVPIAIAFLSAFYTMFGSLVFVVIVLVFACLIIDNLKLRNKKPPLNHQPSLDELGYRRNQYDKIMNYDGANLFATNFILSMAESLNPDLTDDEKAYIERMFYRNSLSLSNLKRILD